MFKIGRYRIAFGFSTWIQTKVPTTIRHFLFVWIFKEAHPDDMDKKKKFPLGTGMEYEGKVYHYYQYLKAGETGAKFKKEAQ